MADGDLSISLDKTTYAQLYAKMISLSEFEKDSIITYGLKNAAELIRREGKKNLKNRLKKDSKHIKAAAYMAAKKKGPLTNSTTVFVKKKQAKSYGGFNRPPGYVAHFVDRGTVDRYTRKGIYRGKMPANYFWLDAFNAKKAEAENKMVNTINKCITMIMNR